jgi:hypothetical protein
LPNPHPTEKARKDSKIKDFEINIIEGADGREKERNIN